MINVMVFSHHPLDIDAHPERCRRGEFISCRHTSAAVNFMVLLEYKQTQSF